MRKVETLELPEVKLSYKQKLILDVLQDEFHGSAFGPQLLKESESEAIKQLSINEILKAFLPTNNNTIYVIHPIAIYYENKQKEE